MIIIIPIIIIIVITILNIDAVFIIVISTVEPRYNEDLGTMKITLL